LGIETDDQEVLMLLEDLDGAGYPVRKHSVTFDGWLNFMRAFWVRNLKGFGK